MSEATPMHSFWRFSWDAAQPSKFWQVPIELWHGKTGYIIFNSRSCVLGRIKDSCLSSESACGLVCGAMSNHVASKRLISWKNVTNCIWSDCPLVEYYHDATHVLHTGWILSWCMNTIMMQHMIVFMWMNTIMMQHMCGKQMPVDLSWSPALDKQSNFWLCSWSILYWVPHNTYCY